MVERIHQVQIFGARCFVADCVGPELNANETLAQLVSRDSVDIFDYKALTRYVGDSSASVIVNFIGFTDVSGAQNEQNRAVLRHLNVELPRQLAILCGTYRKRFIHISSDFVFAGAQDYQGPYHEGDYADSTPNSIGKYARSKREGEREVFDANSDASVVRISYPFGHIYAKNPMKDFAIKMMVRALRGDKIFNDQQLTPTYLPDLRLAIERIIKLNERGIFHVATTPPVTPYEFTAELLKLWRVANNIQPASAEQYLNTPGVTPFPLYGGLDVSLTESRLSLKFSSWQKALKEYVPKIRAVWHKLVLPEIT